MRDKRNKEKCPCKSEQQASAHRTFFVLMSNILHSVSVAAVAKTSGVLCVQQRAVWGAWTPSTRWRSAPVLTSHTHTHRGHTGGMRENGKGGTKRNTVTTTAPLAPSYLTPSCHHPYHHITSPYHIAISYHINIIMSYHIASHHIINPHLKRMRRRPVRWPRRWVVWTRGTCGVGRAGSLCVVSVWWVNGEEWVNESE